MDQITTSYGKGIAHSGKLYHLIINYSYQNKMLAVNVFANQRYGSVCTLTCVQRVSHPVQCTFVTGLSGGQWSLFQVCVSAFISGTPLKILAF